MSAEKVAHTPGPWIISRDPRPNMEWNNSIAARVLEIPREEWFQITNEEIAA